MEDLVLDPSIRDWVLIPIFIIMFLMGLLRNNVTKMMKGAEPTKRETVQQNNTLMRSRRLRANAGWVPPAAFAARKHYFVEKEKGLLMQKQEAPNPMSMMQDPNMMTKMMQGNMTMMVPQMIMMSVIPHFFSGFVLGKIPFPLTPSFKGMLQRGVDLKTLDTAYITSMSWYILAMFGMRGLYSIVLGSGASTDDSAIMQQQMGMGQQGQPGQPPDFNKLFAAEAENMQIVEHNFRLAAADEKLLRGARKVKNA
mmetsp:Transcript_15865/g.48159  ORF Transcript_15865/g.48159 Transcript_15865/m.48159 type:complete len:253 (-) Transcript_15865:368-1126(-)